MSATGKDSSSDDPPLSAVWFLSSTSLFSIFCRLAFLPPVGTTRTPMGFPGRFTEPRPTLHAFSSTNMQSVLPYTTNPAQIASIEKLKLINPSSAAATGPYVSVSDPKLVVGGLLHNWDAEAAHALLNAPKSVQTWDLSWTEDETNWEERVHRCTYPEEVEDLLPAKWIGYRVQSDVDETLARVCKLCTVLVDRFVSLSQGNNANVSTAKWRQRQALYDRLGAVMELLEASVGEAIPILKLKDAEFIHNCWRQMQDDERVEIMSVLGTKEYD